MFLVLLNPILEPELLIQGGHSCFSQYKIIQKIQVVQIFQTFCRVKFFILLRLLLYDP